MKYQIKHRFTAAVLYECDLPDDLDSGLHARHALEKAVSDGADLTDAKLYGANLTGANLDGANLTGANLYCANLTGANLTGANLDGANLTDAKLLGANLIGANLTDAKLYGANLTGAKLTGGAVLIGERSIFQIGPIGSRCAYFVAYITDQGLRFDAGCQRQITREQFEERLADEHGDNIHAKEYRAALALIDVHAELWTPKTESTTEGD